MNLIIGTRGSKLALWQAEWVAARLRTAGFTIELRVIKTTGDRLTASALAAPDTKGLFIKEIEEALLRGGSSRIDIAVHSLKDLPVDQPPGLSIAAVPEREDARDALLSRLAGGLAQLPHGARVGTGSPRRRSQLLALRPDLDVAPIRGNVDTRLRKLDRGDCDALVIAAAGLNRLGLGGRITECFSPEQMCPAAGQGAMAIEIRSGDPKAALAVQPLNHEPTRVAVCAERAALRRLGGGCRMPVAAFARIAGGSIEITGVVADPDGGQVIRATLRSAASGPERAGFRLAEDLLKLGASALLGASSAV